MMITPKMQQDTIFRDLKRKLLCFLEQKLFVWNKEENPGS